MMHKSIYSFESLVSHNKENVKEFLCKMIMLDYFDRHVLILKENFKCLVQ